MTATTSHRVNSIIILRWLSQRLIVAMRSTPLVAVSLLPTAAWAIAASGLGLLLGFAAVILPPTGTFGIVAVAAVVLLWAMPDLATVPVRAVRVTFFVMLIVSLTVPSYYTLIVPGLPWVSARRLATFALIIPFLLTLAGSSAQQRNIFQIFIGSKYLSIFCLGFLGTAAVASITSSQMSASVAIAVDIVLTWYIPLFAVIFVLRNEQDVLLVIRIIILSAIFVAIIAVFEFITHRPFFLGILPRPILASILQANPYLPAGGFNFRNGNPRVSSLFVSPLSLGEFQAMVAPLTFYFLVHGKSAREKLFGLFAAAMCLVAIYCSGSRGAYSCLIIATIAFVALWLLRKRQFNRYSLLPAAGGAMALVAFGALIVLIFAWARLHNIILGGGAQESSDIARQIQWTQGLPKILSSPIVGHGLGTSGNVVGYYNASGDPTIDSFALAILVDAGIPGFVFYFGMIVVGIGFGAWEYLTNPTRSGAVAGAMACSLIAYGIYRVNLAQRENQLLFFIIMGMLMWLANARKRAMTQQAERFSSAPVRVRISGAT